MNRSCVIVSILLFVSIMLAYFPTVYAQLEPEPQSPDEEWYPPEPSSPRIYMGYYAGISGFIASAPSPAAITLLLLDINDKVRSEFYGSEMFYTRFISPFKRFFIYLYEWYPPGTVPSGHWLIYAWGPIEAGSGAIVNIGYFYPEINEPIGLHTWKCWLYDPDYDRWATGIVRFNYYKYPIAFIERIDAPQEIIVNNRYELSVYIKNLGEIDYTYAVRVSGLSTITPTQLTLNVKAKSQSNAIFSFSTSTPGIINLVIDLYADNTILDTKALTLTAKVLKPGPMIIGDFSPAILKEGEEISLSFTFINSGEGEARQVFARIDAPGFMVISGMDSSPNVPPGGAGRTVFVLRPIEGGRKTVQVKITYSDIVGNAYTDTISATLLVQVRLKAYSQDDRGNPVEIPLKINGENFREFEDWIDPALEMKLEAPSEFYSASNNMTRWVFIGWSDGISTPLRTIRLTKSSVIYAIYRKENYISVFSPYGSISGSGWHKSGSDVTISINPTIIELSNGTRFVFTHWTGDIISESPVITFKAESPITLKAFWKAQYYLSIRSDYGSPQGEGWYDSGTVASFRVASPVDYGNGSRKVFIRWIGDYNGDANPGSIKINSPKQIIALWKTQHYLSMETNYGSLVPSSGWYDAETTIQISAEPPDAAQGERYLWSGWMGMGAGSYTGTDNPVTITINAPIKQRANWVRQFYLTVKSDFGYSKGEGWYNEGETATFSVNSPLGFLIQQVFTGWSGDSTATTPTATIIMDGPKTVIANWRTDYTGLVAIVLFSVSATLLSVFFYRKRKKRLTETITLEPSEISILGNKGGKEQIIEYLERLERLYKMGKINEETYSRLKTEYEEKLKQ